MCREGPRNLRLFPESANADARRLVWARSLRAIGDGYVSVLLPAYLILGSSCNSTKFAPLSALISGSSVTMTYRPPWWRPSVEVAGAGLLGWCVFLGGPGSCCAASSRGLLRYPAWEPVSDDHALLSRPRTPAFPALPSRKSVACAQVAMISCLFVPRVIVA